MRGSQVSIINHILRTNAHSFDRQLALGPTWPELHGPAPPPPWPPGLLRARCHIGRQHSSQDGLHAVTARSKWPVREDIGTKSVGRGQRGAVIQPMVMSLPCI